jgi:hypothetical protein
MLWNGVATGCRGTRRASSNPTGRNLRGRLLLLYEVHSLALEHVEQRLRRF